MNLWYHYPSVFWNTACLSVNAGATEESEDSKSTAYGKIGIAIGQMQKEGIRIFNPLINEAQFRFEPDVENNAIIYALKAINGIGDDVASAIIKNRPYTSFDDFCTRMIETKIVQNKQMIRLIQGGAFLELDDKDRLKTMRKYLMKYKFHSVEKLTMSQFNSMKEFGIIPSEYEIRLKYINFKQYVLHPDGLHKEVVIDGKKVPKCGYHDRLYILDQNSQKFFTEHLTENCVVDVSKDGYFIVSEKQFVKEMDSLIQPLKDWFGSQEALDAYNSASFQQIWDQYASGNEAHWSMQSLTYYDQKHELDGVNRELYGIENYFEMQDQPEPYDYYTRWIGGVKKKFPKYRISRLAGTVVNADNNHHSIALLTMDGVVTIKVNKEKYAFYTRRITRPDPNGGKATVIEDSWFKRGNLLVVNGYRKDDGFVLKTYKDSIYKHTINKILAVNPDGTLEIQTERAKIT